MNDELATPMLSPATYYVDEAGDGVFFGPKGRIRAYINRASMTD